MAKKVVNKNKILTLQINSQRPWENIEFPQTKTDNNIYQLNIIIPNQNIYYDKIYKIINDIKNNI